VLKLNMNAQELEEAVVGIHNYQEMIQKSSSVFGVVPLASAKIRISFRHLGMCFLAIPTGFNGSDGQIDQYKYFRG
jgi:hypothetical protein